MKNVLITGAKGFIGRALCLKVMTMGWQVRGTERLAQQAIDANVRRFFFMSSIKVRRTEVRSQRSEVRGRPG